MLRKFPKSQLICRIDMSAFLAIQIVMLLVFWPIPGVFRTQKSVMLPEAVRATEQQRALREDAIYIAVARDGTIFCGQTKLPPSKLHACIRDKIIKGSEPKIYIRADARARYGTVAAVLNAVRESGIENVAFLAEQPPTKSAAQ